MNDRIDELNDSVFKTNLIDLCKKVIKEFYNTFGGTFSLHAKNLHQFELANKIQKLEEFIKSYE